MPDFVISTAASKDVPELSRALELLSEELGDRHSVGGRELIEAGFDGFPCFVAMLARCEGKPAGIALFSPAFSTVCGGPGIHVSDLWIDPAFRKSGLGKRLLHAAVAEGRRRHNAGFIRLTAYHHSHAARQFYERIGFRKNVDEDNFVLAGERFQSFLKAPR